MTVRQGVQVPMVTEPVVVLVEGVSDREAVVAAAGVLGVDLTARGIAVLAMGGVTNVRHFLRELTAGPSRRCVLGLCDVGEAAVVGRALADADTATTGDEEVALRSGAIDVLARNGFHVCDRDLEDELIRALGTSVVTDIIGSCGGLRAFRSLQQQPAQRGRSVHDQLRRWLGSGATRKISYAPRLVAATTPQSLPAPLADVLGAAVAATGW